MAKIGSTGRTLDTTSLVEVTTLLDDQVVKPVSFRHVSEKLTTPTPFFTTAMRRTQPRAKPVTPQTHAGVWPTPSSILIGSAKMFSGAYAAFYCTVGLAVAR
jgi:hypothetical protein